MSVVIDLSTLFVETAKVADLPRYEAAVHLQAGAGEDVVLTGQAPIWMYLRLAHALHGRAGRLSYRSPALTGGDIVIFDHNPY